MTIFNSQVTRPEDVLRGSGMLEIALYGSDDYFNVGAISNMIWDEGLEVYDGEIDDIYESGEVTGQNCKFSFVQHEYLNSDLNTVLRGFDTTTEILDGTTEQIKVVSGDLTTLNEVKARVTTKINGLLYYVYLHRGNLTKGKTLAYKPDAAADDNRIKQPVEIIFMPDSVNSDQIYYTIQPAVYNEKHHKTQGLPFEGITLFIGPSGNMPLSGWTLYGSETYGDSTYAPAGFYESRLMFNDDSFSSMTWTATGGANDIKFSWRHGNTPDSLGDWSSEVNAIGSGSQVLTGKYLQYRFIFHSSYWYDTDSVIVNSIS